MLNQEYYNFEKFEDLTNNIRKDRIAALGSIIEMTKIDPKLAGDLFQISSLDLQQLKRMNKSDAEELIDANSELLTFEITSEEIYKAKNSSELPINYFKNTPFESIMSEFYMAQKNALLDLIDLVKSGGEDLARLLYQINSDQLTSMLTMRQSEIYKIVDKIQLGLVLNRKFSQLPISDTVMLLSSTAKHKKPIKAMLIDSVLNMQNHESSQEDFQKKMLQGRPLREAISMNSHIPRNSALVWSAHRATSTEKFINLYLASNFKKILKAKTNRDKLSGADDKIFPEEAVEASGKTKSTSFSWASGRFEQLKVYLLVSMYTTVFENAPFKRFPTLHEITLLCFAFELKYKLRNSGTKALNLSHVHGIMNKIPLIYGDHLEKTFPGYEALRKQDEEPQPGFVKTMCAKCSTEFYITRSSNTQKCVWCNENLHKKSLRKLTSQPRTSYNILELTKVLHDEKEKHAPFAA